MTHSGRSLRVASGLVLCLLALVLFWARNRSTGAVEVRAEAHRERPVERAPVETDGPWRSPVQAATEDAAPEIGALPEVAEHEPLEVAGWVRNLENQSYKPFAFDASTFNRTSIYFVGDPRTYGGSLTINF